MPRGNPLKPVEIIWLSNPTMTAPILVFGSFDFKATLAAMFRKYSFHSIYGSSFFARSSAPWIPTAASVIEVTAASVFSYSLMGSPNDANPAKVQTATSPAIVAASFLLVSMCLLNSDSLYCGKDTAHSSLANLVVVPSHLSVGALELADDAVCVSYLVPLDHIDPFSITPLRFIRIQCRRSPASFYLHKGP